MSADGKSVIVGDSKVNRGDMIHLCDAATGKEIEKVKAAGAALAASTVVKVQAKVLKVQAKVLKA